MFVVSLRGPILSEDNPFFEKVQGESFEETDALSESKSHRSVPLHFLSCFDSGDQPLPCPGISEFELFGDLGVVER